MAKKERKKSSFWSDFKKFISKGNVIDMAVGVVIGGAFGKIVTGLVNYIINPFVGIFIQSGSLDGIKTIIHPAIEEVKDAAGNIITPASKEVAILWGTWFNTIIDFLITAFCIFIVLRVIMRTKNKLNEKQEAEAAEKARLEKEAADAAAAAAAEAEAAKAAKQKELDESILRQEKILAEMCEILKSKN